MGIKIEEYFKRAYEMGGLKAKMRLAIITKTPSNRAKNIPDETEVLKRFEKGIKEIKNEFMRDN